MASRAVLIPHGSDGPANKDRASTWLRQLGYELDWRYVEKGDSLDQPDDSVEITIIYGGGKPENHKNWRTNRYPWLKNETRWAEQCIARNIPTIGICLGGRSLPMHWVRQSDLIQKVFTNSATTR